jgi:hypothetical protein
MTTCLATQSEQKSLHKPGLGRHESMEILKIRARVVRHDFRDLAGKPDSRQGIFSDSPSLSDRDYFLYADLEDELRPRF